MVWSWGILPADVTNAVDSFIFIRWYSISRWWSYSSCGVMCTHIKPAQNNTQRGKCGRIISAGATQRPVCFVVLKQECATAQKAVCYWLSTYVYMLSFPLILFTSGPNIFASQSVVVLHWSAPLHQQDVPCLRASASRRRRQGCSCRQCRGCLVVSLLNLHLIQVFSSSGWGKKAQQQQQQNTSWRWGWVRCPPPQKNKENYNTSIKKSSHEDRKGKKNPPPCWKHLLHASGPSADVNRMVFNITTFIMSVSTWIFLARLICVQCLHARGQHSHALVVLIWMRLRVPH